jgi:hypothetical protein
MKDSGPSKARKEPYLALHRLECCTEPTIAALGVSNIGSATGEAGVRKWVGLRARRALLVGAASSDKLTTFSVAEGKHKTRHHPDRGTQKGRELGWGVDVSDPYLYHDEPLRRHGFFKAWI